MKKLAAVFIVMLFASTAYAQVISNPSTNARMNALGLSNWQIEDDFNIWINPAQVANYKNGIYGELGTTAGASTGPEVNELGGAKWAGLHLDSAVGTWGLYVGRPYGGPLSATGTLLSGGGSLNALALGGAGTAPTTNRFDLFYGLPGMPIGVYLSYANVDTELNDSVTPSNNIDKTSTEINIAAGGLFMGGALEAALNVGFPSSEDKVANVEDDVGANLAALVRHHGNFAGSRLLSTAQIALTDASYKAAAGTTDDETFGWRLDTALNSRPNSDTLIVAGIGISGSNREFDPPGTGKVEVDTLAIPLNLAVEHQTFNKVQTRFGVSKNIYDSLSCDNVDSTTTCADADDTGNADIDTIADGAATVSVGLGWAVHDNLTLDAVINQDVLFTGTDLISGVPETLNSMLSATYRFQ